MKGLKIDIEKELAYYNSVRGEIISMTTDTIAYSHDAINSGKRILIEGKISMLLLKGLHLILNYLGANAAMLDLDFGTYPYVTSSNPTVGSVCTGLGIPPLKINNVTGIVKAYCTRVGEGCNMACSMFKISNYDYS